MKLEAEAIKELSQKALPKKETEDKPAKATKKQAPPPKTVADL